ncbi:MAG: flavin reductase family protein, partial [Actinobacteria bacterium]
EHANVMAVAWINVVSSTPPTVAMGIRESRATLELIRETGTFSVNVATASMADVVDYCGMATGRNADKIGTSGLTLAPGAVISTPVIEQCPVNLECRVTEEVVVGSYVVILGEIVETHADESVLASPDGGIVDMEKLDPIVYIAGAREYRRLGEKVADAYSVGKPLLDGNSD